MNSPIIKRSLVILAALALASSCSSKSGMGASDPGGSANVSGGQAPDTTSNTDSSSNTSIFANETGASVAFAMDSLTSFNTYVAERPINNPTNLQLYVELNDVGSGRWGGTVKIGYYDNGQLRMGTFSTTNPTGYQTNRVSYKNMYVGLPNAEFNQWFTVNGKRVFHGFFQDAYGAIVLVIDGGLDLGDGGGLTELSGSVWFKNFKLAPAPQYMGGNGEMCWFLLPPSPYECGTFKSGDRINTTSALYPGDGYTRLGTFSGLNKAKAFR